MSLKERLEAELKEAMRSRDALRRSVIRNLRSEIHNDEIARQADLDEEGTIRVLSRQAQQRRESIEAYTQGNRGDLAEQEKAELAIIQEYLPEQLSDEEIAELVRQAIDEVGAAGPQDMGKVMGRVMLQIKGRAEGRRVSSTASKLLKDLDG